MLAYASRALELISRRLPPVFQDPQRQRYGSLAGSLPSSSSRWRCAFDRNCRRPAYGDLAERLFDARDLRLLPLSLRLVKRRRHSCSKHLSSSPCTNSPCTSSRLFSSSNSSSSSQPNPLLHGNTTLTLNRIKSIRPRYTLGEIRALPMPFMRASRCSRHGLA